jgi:hypothetical protein
MTYKQAIEKSLTVKWKVGTCDQGEKCWCRTIKCEQPVMFKEREDDEEDEYWVVGPAELNKETVEHIVKLHNESINQ